MSERTEAEMLANRVLDRPYADPDDDLAILARQFLRCRETVERQEKALQAVDWEAKGYADLVNANRDTILRITEEGLRRVVRCLKAGDISTALKVIEAVNTFHPMHGESWIGWPEGSS